jgi:glycosyltransferase involved in cell wall biosynthesis
MNGFGLQVTPVCRELAARGHEVCVLAYLRPDQRGEPPPGVELHTIERPDRRALASARWVFGRRPLGAITAYQPIAESAAALVDEREFDVVHVAGWPLAELGRRLDQLPSVLTVFDANYLNYSARRDAARAPLNAVLAEETRRVVRFERTAYRTHHAVVVVTAEDAAALRRLDPALPVVVVPNGVDTDHFRPDPSTARELGLVVMTGAMHWAPNVAAARFLVDEVLPRLRRQRPRAHVAIVGRRPSGVVLKLGTRENVTVTGEVPEILDWLARAHV